MEMSLDIDGFFNESYKNRKAKLNGASVITTINFKQRVYDKLRVRTNNVSEYIRKAIQDFEFLIPDDDEGCVEKVNTIYLEPKQLKILKRVEKLWCCSRSESVRFILNVWEVLEILRKNQEVQSE